VGGLRQSNQFDSITVVDIEREFQTVFTTKTDMLPSSVKPEVIERVLGIATELAVEGREGHPVGCLFALGNADKISEFSKPLILNPFYGYKDEDRNILNPFMDETVKELSSIDGAFIIRGDGVLISAGSLLHPPEYNHELPGGLGSRHAAAAAITQAVDCLCIVVSGSTGQVTLFRKGKMLPLIEKALVRNS
jgi:DNA integrity scanning protein DisA with diadenylate cyclase activity